MRYLLTGEEMKELDTYSIQKIGIPSLVLMERAALSVTEEIKKKEKKDQNFLIIAGTGNNGADGLAVARMLTHTGYEKVSVLLVGNIEKSTEEWKIQHNILNNLNRSLLISGNESLDISCYDVIVDAIFGTGLQREIKGAFYEIISLINNSNAITYSVDIPSGISSKTGEVMGIGVKADITITFGYEKLGCILYPGSEYSGKVVVKDIGFPMQALLQVNPQAVTYDKTDLCKLPKRYAYSNKGTYGKVLVIAGSKNMSGAAFLSAGAAYRMGAGLVRILSVEENRQILQSLLPEAIISTYKSDSIDWQLIEEAVSWAKVVIIGPGFGNELYAEKLLKFVMDYAKVPLIIDADGINILATHREWWGKDCKNRILTPHLGELSRLTKKSIAELSRNLVSFAKALAGDLHATVICKDARTVVASEGELTYVNTSGNSGMATGGSGDVLTGVIAGLLAGGLAPYEAAALGVFLHGLAGDEAKIRQGEYSMKATDIMESLSCVTKEGYRKDERI